MDASDRDNQDPLRTKAEELLQDRPRGEDEASLPPEKIRGLLHDLRVHQLELELQNEELRSTHLELQKARDKFARLYNQAPVIYLSVDANGIIRQFNQTFLDLTGYYGTEINDTPLADLLDQSSRETFLSRFRALYKNPENKSLELNLRTHNNKYLPVRLSGRIEETDKQGSGSNRHLLLILSDISEQKLAREQIRRKNAQLQKSLAERDRFMSIIAHDLKSPLSGFLGSARIMAEDIHSLTPDELQHVSSEMHKSAENLYTLLENLLTWARMQKGDVDFEPVEMDMQEVIRQNIELARGFSPGKNISIESRVPRGLSVYGDKNMLGTVLRNLLANAVKYTPAGGSVITGAERQEGVIQIFVQDTGVGMDQHTLEGLFQLGLKTNSPGTQGEKGTGLGLILCLEMIHRHQGEIWARSEQGKGSTFYFTLPAPEI